MIKYSLFGLLLLAACGPQLPNENIIAEGKIAAINEKRIMVQDASHVLAIKLDDPDPQLLKRAKPGQSITLLGKKTGNAEGSSEQLHAIVLEDGTRFFVND